MKQKSDGGFGLTLRKIMNGANRVLNRTKTIQATLSAVAIEINLHRINEKPSKSILPFFDKGNSHLTSFLFWIDTITFC